MGRRRWAWVAGGFGLVAVLRGLARRRSREEEPPLAFAPDAAAPTEPEPDPRAEELRTRRDVHDEARAAIDEMAGPSAEE
jgi:hypothetical protein